MSLIDYKNIDIYQGEKLVLQDVNFHVDEGEFMYIIGSVGSGKSSLLKTFYCELDIWHEENKEEEKAEVLERDIFNLKRKEVPALRREMGIIFQDFKLLHEMTVRKNLEFVLKSTGWKSQKDINERIESVLTDVGMLDKIDKLPHELSGNLDPDTAGKIIGLLKDISTTGTAVVMTTHNIPMLDRFPGIVYRCKDGAINDVTTEYNKMDLSEDAQYDAQP